MLLYLITYIRISQYRSIRFFIRTSLTEKNCYCQLKSRDRPLIVAEIEILLKPS